MRKNKNQSRNAFKRLVLLSAFLLAGVGMLSSTKVLAQTQGCTNPAALTCQVDANCEQQGCPSCVVCIQGTCVPNDAICEDISGGGEVNDCRTAQCSDFVNFANPSGCDYNLVETTSTNDCRLCSEPLPPDFSNCGNGVCEKPDESFANCSLDCRVPGFTGPLLSEGNPTLEDACTVAITFSGPPYNEPNSNFCEDGDICTSNDCNNNGNCEVVELGCSGNEEDLCCPQGCEPPAEGQNCPDLLGSDCDVDCRPIENCGTTPGVLPVLQGSGVFMGGCSLNPVATLPSVGIVGMLAVVLSMAFGLRLRRNAK